MTKYITFLLLITVLAQKSLAATISSPQTQPLDLSQRISKYHAYDLAVNLVIKPKQAISIIALSKAMEFQLKCGEALVGFNKLLFDDSMAGKTFTLSISAPDVRLKCPNGVFNLVMNPNGVELEADLSSVVPNLIDIGEDADGFILRYNAEHDSYVSDMIYFHSQMSESINNRESFHCLIKGYESDFLKDEIVRDLLKEYRKNFGFDYVASDIDCEMPISLAAEVNSCATTSRTSFCGNYRLYLESIGWLKEARSKAAFFKSQIPSSLQELNDQLQVIVDQIDKDLKTSVAQTGAA